jgi:hypothetical protein
MIIILIWLLTGVIGGFLGIFYEWYLGRDIMFEGFGIIAISSIFGLITLYASLKYIISEWKGD